MVTSKPTADAPRALTATHSSKDGQTAFSLKRKEPFHLIVYVVPGRLSQHMAVYFWFSHENYEHTVENLRWLTTKSIVKYIVVFKDALRQWSMFRDCLEILVRCARIFNTIIVSLLMIDQTFALFLSPEREASFPKKRQNSLIHKNSLKGEEWQLNHI